MSRRPKMRGAWGGLNSRGGHRLPRRLRGPGSAESLVPVCSACGSALGWATQDVGRFVRRVRACSNNDCLESS